MSSVEDPLWNTTFRDLFTPEAFPVPFYPIRGNHDYHSSNPDAQLEYYDTHGVDGRWIFPAAYYLLHEVLGDGTTIDFIFLDTPLLVPEEAETAPSTCLVKRPGAAPSNTPGSKAPWQGVGQTGSLSSDTTLFSRPESMATRQGW